jgi:hypothetical protein
MVLFFMYDPVNMSYEIFNLAKTWGGGHKISDMTPIQAIG